METLSRKNIFSSTNFKPLLKCGKYLDSLKHYSFTELLRSVWQHLSEGLTSVTLKKTLHLPAFHGWAVGNSLRVTHNELMTNNRLAVGTVLMYGVAPVLYMAYLFFINPDVPYEFPLAFITDDVIPGWHYHRVYYWMYTNREELFYGLGLTGFFMLQPIKFKYKYLLLPYVAVAGCEVLFQSLQIDSWDDFYIPLLSNVRGWEMAVVMLALTIAGHQYVNYTVYRKYHLKDGNAARIMGVFALEQLTWDQKKVLLEQLKDEMENFNNRV